MKNGQSWTAFAPAAAVVAAATLACAFPLTFTHVRIYDDTGYMLALISNFNRHGGLYTRVYSQYGPFYSEFYALLSRLIGGSPTQDGIRWIVVAMWLVSSAAGGVLAFRLTRNVAFAAPAQGLCALLLTTLGFDAGHPISLSVLCLTVAAICLPRPHPVETPAVSRSDRGLPWRAVGFGAALGALAMLKINLGVFALAAVGTAWTFSTPWDRAGRALRWMAGGLLCLLPVLLVGKAWPGTTRLAFIVLMLAVFAGALLVMSRDRAVLTWRASVRLVLGMSGGWVLACAACVTGIVATGTRPADVLDGMLRRPLGLATIFNVTPNTSLATLLVAGTALGGALAWRFGLPGSPEGDARRARFEFLARAGFLGLIALWLVLEKGLSLTLPFLWIALLPVEPALDPVGPFARRSLALLAAAQFLSLYPVAGVQAVVPGYLVALTAVVLAAQARAQFLARSNDNQVSEPSGQAAGTHWRPATAAAGVFLVAIFGVRTVAAWRVRAAQVPLNLLGSALVRGEEGRVAGYTFLARTLAGEPSFLTLPGINSLYGWAEVAYPADLNCTENFALLNPAEQRALVEVGRRCKPVAMVYEGPLLDFWAGHNAPVAGPLVDFQRWECRPLGEAQGFTLLRCTAGGQGFSGPSGLHLTHCALLEQKTVQNKRLPSGRVRLLMPPGLKPADVLLVDNSGNPLAPPVKLAKASADSVDSVLTLPDAGVLRARSPDEMCLRLRDGAGQRLTTVPFFIPADVSIP